MPQLIERTPDATTVIEREGRRVTARTLVHDDSVLKANEKLRAEGPLKRGDKLPLVPAGAEVITAFSIPIYWASWLRHKRPDIWHGLHSRDQVDRERAMRILADMHPEWVVTSPRIRAFGGPNIVINRRPENAQQEP